MVEDPIKGGERKMAAIFELLRTDITKLPVDAIVNAAGNRLSGGTGLDGVIHRAAGPNLRMACSKLGGCPTGEARITPGFNLSARFVIHTVGPIWRGGNYGETATLASCYTNCLSIAKQYGVKSIAFPGISTGNFGFPPEKAAFIALSTVVPVVMSDENWERVVFAFIDSYVMEPYKRTAKRSRVSLKISRQLVKRY